MRICRVITFCLIIVINLNAANYIPNKNYTYNEVTEILSDEIIKLKKLMEEVNLKLEKQEKEINELNLKVNKLSNPVINKIKKQVDEEDSEKKEGTNKKLIPNQIQEIVIDKELYEKVK